MSVNKITTIIYKDNDTNEYEQLPIGCLAENVIYNNNTLEAELNALKERIAVLENNQE